MQAERIVKPFGAGPTSISVEFRWLPDIGPDTLLRVTLRGRTVQTRSVQLDEQAGISRNCTLEEIRQFMEEDNLGPATAAKVKQLLA